MRENTFVKKYVSYFRPLYDIFEAHRNQRATLSDPPSSNSSRKTQFTLSTLHLANHARLCFSFSRVVSRNRILTRVTPDTTTRALPFHIRVCSTHSRQRRTFSGAHRLAKASDSQFAAATRLRSRVFTSTRWQLWVRSRSKGVERCVKIYDCYAAQEGGSGWWNVIGRPLLPKGPRGDTESGGQGLVGATKVAVTRV